MSAELNEIRLPEQLQTPACFDFYMGRVALYALLMALEVGPGDEIIVPIYTCPSVIEPILILGATPVYCDIESRTYGLDPHKLATVLSENTRAAIIQHTYGIPARLAELLDILRTRAIATIEDCCHVLASKYCGRELGRFGDAAIFSFASGKQISLHTGGLAIVNSPRLHETMIAQYHSFSETTPLDEIWINAQLAMEPVKRLVNARFPVFLQVQLNRARHYLFGVPPSDLASTHSAGPRYGKRMPRTCRARFEEIQAKFGDFVSARRRLIERYEKGFRSIGLKCFTPPSDSEVLLWRYPLVTLNKTEVLREAERYNVKLSDWGKLPLEFLRDSALGPRYLADRFPVATQVLEHLVSLGMNEFKPEQDVDRTLEFLRAMKKRGWF
jgi:perosamine synthetase